MQASKHDDRTAVCLACHYPLRGLPETNACPECGSLRRFTPGNRSVSNTALFSLILGSLAAASVMHPSTMATGLLLGPTALITGTIANLRAHELERSTRLIALSGRVLGSIGTIHACAVQLFTLCSIEILRSLSI